MTKEKENNLIAEFWRKENWDILDNLDEYESDNSDEEEIEQRKRCRLLDKMTDEEVRNECDPDGGIIAEFMDKAVYAYESGGEKIYCLMEIDQNGKLENYEVSEQIFIKKTK